MTFVGRSIFAAGPAGAMLALAACGSSADSPGSSGGVRPDGGDVDGGGIGKDGQVGPDGAPLPDGSSSGGDAAPDAPPPKGDGRVTLRLPDGKWHRVSAKEGGAVEDLSTPMDAVSSGSDDFLNTAKDGAWIVTIGSRFGCNNGNCIDLFSGDGSKGDLVTPSGGAVVTKEGRAAVSSDGNVVVYPAAGPHTIDLYAVTRGASGWGAPVLLTGASTFDFHHDVQVAYDGSRAVFDCGADPYAQPPTSICEVKTDGTGFVEVLGPADGPDKGASHALHHPDYTPQGDFVFEADWPSEQIWKVARGSKTPVKVSPDEQTDDNSPCVLPNGKIASLWLGRQGNMGGAHELKVMGSDGSGSVMVLTGQDIVDIGIGCGD